MRVADQVVVGQRPRLVRRRLDAEERVERVDLVAAAPTVNVTFSSAALAGRAPGAPGRAPGRPAAEPAAAADGAREYVAGRDPSPSRPAGARASRRAHRARRARDPTPTPGCARPTPALLDHLAAERAWYDAVDRASALPGRRPCGRDGLAGARRPSRRSVAAYEVFLLHPCTPPGASTRRSVAKSAVSRPFRNRFPRSTASATKTAPAGSEPCSTSPRWPTTAATSTSASRWSARTSACSPTPSTRTGDEVYALRFRDLAHRRGPARGGRRAATTAAPGAPTRRGSSTPSTTRPTGRTRSGGTGSALRSTDDVLVLEEPDERFDAARAGEPERRRS